jgi:hypothetical protein
MIKGSILMSPQVRAVHVEPDLFEDLRILARQRNRNLGSQARLRPMQIMGLPILSSRDVKVFMLERTDGKLIGPIRQLA